MDPVAEGCDIYAWDELLTAAAAAAAAASSAGASAAADRCLRQVLPNCDADCIFVPKWA